MIINFIVMNAKLVHFNISQKLSTVSLNPNAEHVNQDTMLVSFLLMIKIYCRNAKINY